MADKTIFEGYSVAKWKVGTDDAIMFPVLDITESGGNRIVPHPRPFRNGAKLDDTGSKPRQWAFTAIFNNSVQEPDIPDSGSPLYPTVLRQIIRSFDVHETGTLTLPTVGDVRVRAQDYTRKEAPEAEDQATLELVFVQDNEDALDRAQLTPPGVVATLVRLAEQTVFTEQKNGIWNDDVKSLPEIAGEIEDMLLAPGRSTAELGGAVRSHRRAIQRIIDAGSTVTDGAFGEPRSSAVERELRILLDREAQAEEERSQSRPRTKAFVIDVERTSIFEVAARLNQDAEELLDLNTARIDDPFLLDRGMVIRVFESAR